MYTKHGILVEVGIRNVISAGWLNLKKNENLSVYNQSIIIAANIKISVLIAKVNS